MRLTRKAESNMPESLSSPFATFDKMMGPPQACQPAERQIIEAYRPILPAVLITYWEVRGWCSYGDSFLWFTDPRQFDPALEGWLVFTDEPPSIPPIIFARTGLADLFIWLDNNVYYVNTYGNYLAKMGPDITSIFDGTLCEPAFRDQVLREATYRHALPRLGQPSVEECYTYVPHPAIGGDGSPSSLTKARMDNWLVVVAITCGPLRAYRRG
jgi:hypothetical protein